VSPCPVAILGLDSQKLATSIGHDRNWVYFLGLVEAAKDNIMNHKPNPILYHGTRKMNNHSWTRFSGGEGVLFSGEGILFTGKRNRDDVLCLWGAMIAMTDMVDWRQSAVGAAADSKFQSSRSSWFSDLHSKFEFHASNRSLVSWLTFL